jgi:hypothetical protein
MLLSDFPAISEEHRKRLTELALECLVKPIENLLVQARQRGQGRDIDARFAALSILATAEALHADARLTGRDPAELVEVALPQVLHGVAR